LRVVGDSLEGSCGSSLRRFWETSRRGRGEPAERCARALAHTSAEGRLEGVSSHGWHPLNRRGGGRRGAPRGVRGASGWGRRGALRWTSREAPLKWSSRVTAGTFRGRARSTIRGYRGCPPSDPSLGVSRTISRPREGGGCSGRRACCPWSRNVVSSLLERRIGGLPLARLATFARPPSHPPRGVRAGPCGPL